MAREIGVSGAYLSRVEHGWDPPPTAERIEAIAEVLDVPAATLVDLARKTGSALDDYVARVPSAGALFLDIARRELDADQIARVAAFIDAEVAATPRAQEPGTATLAALIPPQRIRLQVRARTLAGLTAAGAAVCARFLAGVDEVALTQELADREADSSTALGHGIAVPHVVRDGAPSTAALVVPARALSVATPDEAPVRAVVVLVSGSRDEHLRNLALVARLASHDAAPALARARTRRDAHAVLDAYG